MRILYHHRIASYDGQSTHIEEMINALRRIGHDVVVVSPNIDDTHRSGGSPGWVGWLKRTLPRFVYELLELGYSVIAYQQICRAIRKIKPDAIYERYNLYLLAGAWASKRFGLPFALEVNGPVAEERGAYGKLALKHFAGWTERYVWRRADLAFPITHVLAERMINDGVLRERIVVVPNGVDLDQFRNMPSTGQAKEKLGLANQFVVGFTGFVREWDRLDRVVRWLANYRGPKVPHLLIVGDGPARRDIEECAARFGVSERVHLTGALPRKDVPAAAMAFDIALQTALVPYASPLCLFEYLALGKAILAPNQPNHVEVLRDRVDALLYDPCDPEGIESGLNELCSSESLRNRIAANAANVIRERSLTWLDHAKTVSHSLALVRKDRPGGQV